MLLILFNEIRPVHIEHIQEANPNLEIYVINNTIDADWAGKWLNCDRVMREWWKAYRKKVTSDVIVYFENDVLCTLDLTCLLPVSGYVGFVDPHPHCKDWKEYGGWFQKAAESGDPSSKIRKYPMGGMVSVYAVHRTLLDELIKRRWDHDYKITIICEIRIPSIMAWAKKGFTKLTVPSGYGLRNHCTLIDAETEKEVWDQINNKIPGIYHPVKTAISYKDSSCEACTETETPT